MRRGGPYSWNVTEGYFARIEVRLVWDADKSDEAGVWMGKALVRLALSGGDMNTLRIIGDDREVRLSARVNPADFERAAAKAGDIVVLDLIA